MAEMVLASEMRILTEEERDLFLIKEAKRDLEKLIIALSKNVKERENMRPLNDIVIVRQDKPETISKGGIFVGELEGKLLQGTVLAVGPGKRMPDDRIVPMSVEVGQRVMYSKFANEVIKLDGENLRCLREGDIVGVIE